MRLRENLSNLFQLVYKSSSTEFEADIALPVASVDLPRKTRPADISISISAAVAQINSAGRYAKIHGTVCHPHAGGCGGAGVREVRTSRVAVGK